MITDTLATFIAQTLIPVASESVLAYHAQHKAGEDIQTHRKRDKTLASLADTKTEMLLREVITKTYPDHGIVGEEYRDHNPKAHLVWVLDPLDGTAQFLNGDGTFAILIALMSRGRLLLGAICEPHTKKRWLGGTGKPTTCNGVPVKPRMCHDLNKATIACTSPDTMFGPDHAMSKMMYEKEAPHTKVHTKIRTGRNAIGFADLLTGQADLCIEQDLRLWDIAALLPVLWDAGCYAATLEGESYQREDFSLPKARERRYGIIASPNPDLIKQTLSLTADV